MVAAEVEEKNGVIIERYFYPFGRGVVIRQTNPKSNFRNSVFVSSLCGRTSCAYDTIARKTCKNCKYNMQ